MSNRFYRYCTSSVPLAWSAGMTFRNGSAEPHTHACLDHHWRKMLPLKWSSQQGNVHSSYLWHGTRLPRWNLRCILWLWRTHRWVLPERDREHHRNLGLLRYCRCSPVAGIHPSCPAACRIIWTRKPCDASACLSNKCMEGWIWHSPFGFVR